jgi:hypothetical protein
VVLSVMEFLLVGSGSRHIGIDVSIL